jgi:hypothetical protein
MIPLIRKVIKLRGGTDNDIILSYRNVFGTDEGRKVLLHMLFEMRYFDSDVQTEEGRIMRNYATRLLQRIGALEPEYFIDAMMNALMKVPLTDEEGNIYRGEGKNMIE